MTNTNKYLNSRNFGFTSWHYTGSNGYFFPWLLSYFHRKFSDIIKLLPKPFNIIVLLLKLSFSLITLILKIDKYQWVVTQSKALCGVGHTFNVSVLRSFKNYIYTCSICIICSCFFLSATSVSTEICMVYHPTWLVLINIYIFEIGCNESILNLQTVYSLR